MLWLRAVFDSTQSLPRGDNLEGEDSNHILQFSITFIETFVYIKNNFGSLHHGTEIWIILNRCRLNFVYLHVTF